MEITDAIIDQLTQLINGDAYEQAYNKVLLERKWPHIVAEIKRLQESAWRYDQLNK